MNKIVGSGTIECVNGTYRIARRERASSGFPRNVHTLSKAYKTREEAFLAMLWK